MLKPSEIPNFEDAYRTYGILAYLPAKDRSEVIAMSPADRKREVKKLEKQLREFQKRWKMEGARR